MLQYLRTDILKIYPHDWTLSLAIERNTVKSKTNLLKVKTEGSKLILTWSLMGFFTLKSSMTARPHQWAFIYETIGFWITFCMISRIDSLKE